MDKFFVPIYKYFKRYRSFMYMLLIVSSIVFIFFGLKLHYEEDISKLLPSAGPEESSLAFGNIQVKDKIIVQITSRDEPLPADVLSNYSDEFVDGLLDRDSSGHYIADVLYRIDDDFPVMALGFALDHVPSFVDSSCYSGFEKAMEPSAVDAAMSRNAERIAMDETGSITQMVSTDPFELRNVLKDKLLGDGTGGFALIDGHLFSRDSTVALAFVSPDFKSFDSKSGTALVDEIEKEVSSFTEEHPQVEVLFHGAPVRSVGNSRTIKKDLALTVGTSLVIILIVLMICFGGLNIVWQNLMPVAYGTFFALACMYWIKGSMSLMALGIGAIVLGVAISYCLHVIIHQKFTGSTEQMLRDESTPVCLGCITTIGAFLGLLFTKSDLLRDFGLFATLALVGNTLFALIFLPHFLKDGSSKIKREAFSLIGKINGYPYDRKPVLLAVVCLVIITGIAFSGKVGFDSDLRHIGYETPQLLRSEALYSEKMTGGHIQRYYAATSDSLDIALASDMIVTRKLDSLKKLEIVKQSSSVTSSLFVPISKQEERIAQWKAWWTGDRIRQAERELHSAARKYGLPEDMFAPFMAMVEGDYSPESLYSAGIIPDGLLSTLIEQSPDGKYLVFNAVQLDSEDEKVVDGQISAIPGAIVVDPFYYMGDMVQLIRDDFNLVLWISSLFVLLVLIAAFRNILVALLSFLPMFLSWYIVQGFMAILGLQFNLINIVISTFIFGIGVDYSIFVMDGLLDKAKDKASSLLEYHKAAIFFSALVLFIVVVSLLFARHPAIYSIGVSTLIGMASTILITYTLQPFLFRLLMKIPSFRARIENGL